jgi:hypothetical protein
VPSATDLLRRARWAGRAVASAPRASARLYGVWRAEGSLRRREGDPDGDGTLVADEQGEAGMKSCGEGLREGLSDKGGRMTGILFVENDARANVAGICG